MSTKKEIDRRTFIGVMGCGGCALALPTVGCTIAEVFPTAGGVLNFDVADPTFAALATVDGMMSAKVGDTAVLFIRTEVDTVIAVNQQCPHGGLSMAPEANGEWDGDRLHCTAHHSFFSATGERLEGPATVGLTVYECTFDSGTGQGRVVVGDVPQESLVPPEFRGKENPFASDDADALAAGQSLWAQCSGCHGAAGEGNDSFPDPKPTAFDSDTSGFDDDYLFWRIRTGQATGPEGSSMPAYSEMALSEEQVWQVLTYLRSLGQ